jgi:single-stranded DNA-binding protein
MADLFAVGRVTADFELKTSANQNPYVRFDLAENIGRGQSSRTQFYQVFVYGEKAQQLVRAKVGKGSLIRISGEVELEDFLRRDGVTKDKRLKVSLYDWRFIPTGRPKSTHGAQLQEGFTSPAESAPEIDGEREALPD